MRIKANKLIFSFILCITSSVFGTIDLSSYESICEDIGFRKKTETFGACVLELAEKDKESSTYITQDDQICKNYGF